MIWKKIDRYENYEVSWYGEIKNKKGEFLKQMLNKSSGYMQVNLYNNGKMKKFDVHRLVALHHIPNPDNKRTVNHKDSDRLNNCGDNLEWNSSSENNTHAHRFGNKKPSYEHLKQYQFKAKS
jgi:hypothetical protein